MKLWMFLFIYYFVCFPGQPARTRYSQQWCNYTRHSHKHIVSSVLTTEEHLTLKWWHIIWYDGTYHATHAALVDTDTLCRVPLKRQQTVTSPAVQFEAYVHNSVSTYSPAELSCFLLETGHHHSTRSSCWWCASGGCAWLMIGLLRGRRKDDIGPL